MTKENLGQLSGQLLMADGKKSTITRDNNAAVGSIPLISIHTNIKLILLKKDSQLYFL